MAEFERGEAYVIGNTGPRGGGKSLLCTYITIVLGLLNDLPVWSNYPIVAVIDGKEYQTLVLNWKNLYNLQPTFRGGIVDIDEIQYFADPYRHNSINNRLLNYFSMQIRKRAMSMLYTAKFEEWVDKRIRYETDILFDCMDAAKSPFFHSKNKERGKMFFIEGRDMSGLWTGLKFYNYPIWHQFLLKEADKVWACYDTDNMIDVFQAMQKINLNLQQLDIGDPSDNANELNLNIGRDIENLVDDLIMSGEKKISSTDFWQMAKDRGIEGHSNKLGSYLKQIGVTQSKGSGNKWFYNLNSFERSPVDADTPPLEV